MNKALFLILFTVSFSVLLGSHQDAHAGVVTVYTAVQNGDWTDPATWDNGVPGAADSKLIPAGITVTISSGISNQDNIENHGIINIEASGGISNDGASAFIKNFGGVINIKDNGGINNNFGFIFNSGTINIDPLGQINNIGGTIGNSLDINNDGTIFNNPSGKISNDAGATINNSGAITNNGDFHNNGGILNNSGTFTNNPSGTIKNDEGGIINNPGTIVNFGTINNFDTINNGGNTIHNFGVINNFGTINNICNAQITENPPQGNLPNFIPCTGIGGEIIPIKATALLLAGLQTSAIWMFPVIAGAAGVAALYLKSRKFF